MNGRQRIAVLIFGQALLVTLTLGGCPHSKPGPGPSGGPPDSGTPYDPHLACNWTQWGQDPAHGGNACAIGQRPLRSLARLEFDPNVPAEQLESDGDLTAHFPVPLIRDDDVYMMFKAGYTPCDPPGSGVSAD